MKLNHLLTAVAACALFGGAAYAQSTSNTAQPGERTGDWNGAHAPTDGSVASERIQPSTGTTTTTVTTSTAAAPSTDTTADVSATTATPSADTSGTPTASVTTTLVTNGPVPDTAENRARFGGPMSRAGKMTAPRGN